MYRLTVRDKDHLKSMLEGKLLKAQRALPFPLTREQMQGLRDKVLPPEVQEAREICRKFDSEMISVLHSYSAKFHISDGEYRFVISINIANWPSEKAVIPASQPAHKDILQWAYTMHEITTSIKVARQYAVHIIDCATTMGQIVRAFPNEIRTLFSKDYLNTLEDAQRASRLPSGVVIDKEKEEIVLRTLSLASLVADDAPPPFAHVKEKHKCSS